jgi:hypothetical protein
MDAEEVQKISVLVTETSKMDESFGQFFDGAARDPTTIFSHTSMCPANASSGVYCNCTFSRMNFNDINAMDAAAQHGLGGLGAKSYQMKVSEQENHVLSNVASSFHMVTAPRSGSQGGVPKPLSPL